MSKPVFPVFSPLHIKSAEIFYEWPKKRAGLAFAACPYCGTEMEIDEPGTVVCLNDSCGRDFEAVVKDVG